MIIEPILGNADCDLALRALRQRNHVTALLEGNTCDV
jgi:hypothetical protein